MSRRAGRVAFTERNPVVIAIVGLVGIAATLALVASWNRLPFVDDSTTYRAEFTDASGLVVGEEVRVAGVKVGKVTDLLLDGDKVVVEFTVSGVELGQRTEAGIEVKTLLGQHYLSVTPAGEDPMPERSTIPLDRTRTPINIVPAFNRLAGTTKRIDTDQVADALDSLSETLRRTAPEMDGALDGLTRLSRTVTRRDAAITELFDRTERVTGVIAERDEELAQLLTASDEVLTVLDDRRELIRAIIRDTRGLAEQVAGLVDDNEAALGPALRDLRSVTSVLRRHEREIEQTLTYAAPYAREFTNVGGSGRWFDATLKFPRGFALCSTGDTTDPVYGLLDPILSALNGSVNGSDSPCLPLGPAMTSRLSEEGVQP
ncbi:MCE family protein [Nocardioides stalactiti]|uniref:MCE family protein n=1 Tax=Nocardioides stalactiti TaxID=2755356 RepID=UPI0016001BF2|nr:MlaD family protein [Nocardioides stalactiti]